MKNLYKLMLFACISLMNSNSLQASNNNNNYLKTTVSTNISTDKNLNNTNELQSNTNNKNYINKGELNRKYYCDGIEKTINTNIYQVSRYPVLNILNKINKQTDNSIDDLLNLLNKIFEDIKKVNNDIDNKKFNDSNYLMGKELLLVFSDLVDNTINKLLNNSTVKAYNLYNKIYDFKTDYIISCGDNKKLDEILGSLKNYIAFKMTHFMPYIDITNIIDIKNIKKYSFYPKNLKK